MNRIYYRHSFSNLSQESSEESSEESEEEKNELLEKSRKLFKDKNLKIKKIIVLDRDGDGLQIITTGKKSIIIRDTTSQNCCEKTSMKHDFNDKFFKKCKIESLSKTNDIRDEYYSCQIKINLSNGEHYTVNCTNIHNGYYSHYYDIMYDDEIIDSFSL